jgi:hypothetical protein
VRDCSHHGLCPPNLPRAQPATETNPCCMHNARYCHDTHPPPPRSLRHVLSQKPNKGVQTQTIATCTCKRKHNLQAAKARTFLHRGALGTCSDSSTPGLPPPAAPVAPAAAAAPDPAAALDASCGRPSMRLKMPSASFSMNSITRLNTAPLLMVRVLVSCCSVSP